MPHSITLTLSDELAFASRTKSLTLSRRGSLIRLTFPDQGIYVSDSDSQVENFVIGAVVDKDKPSGSAAFLRNRLHRFEVRSLDTVARDNSDETLHIRFLVQWAPPFEGSRPYEVAYYEIHFVRVDL